MAEKETEAKTVSKEEYDKVVDELNKVKESYSDLANAFNKLLQEFNEMHVATLFKK